MRCTEHAKHLSQLESIQLMEEFLEAKNILFSKGQEVQKNLEDGEIGNIIYKYERK